MVVGRLWIEPRFIKRVQEVNLVIRDAKLLKLGSLTVVNL